LQWAIGVGIGPLVCVEIHSVLANDAGGANFFIANGLLGQWMPN